MNKENKRENISVDIRIVEKSKYATTFLTNGVNITCIPNFYFDLFIQEKEKDIEYLQDLNLYLSEKYNFCILQEQKEFDEQRELEPEQAETDK